MSKLPDLEAMAIFSKVAEARGITAAARDLGLSAPTISKALTRLEQRLGCRLFNRTSRRLVLTDAGRNLAERAARLLADAEAAEEALAAQSASPRGVVRLAVPMSFGIREVAPLLPAFLALYPEVSIDLDLSDALVDVIGDGFDMALRIGALPDSSLKSRRLAAIRVMVVAAPGYLRRAGRPEHPSALKPEDCFSYALSRHPHAWHLTHSAGETVTVPASGRLRLNNGDALLPALIAGLGVACLPEFLARDALAAGLLEHVLPDWTAARSGLFLLMPPGGPRPARIEVLAEFLARRLYRAEGG